MSNINWKDYEGKEIEVSENGSDWHKRTLIRMRTYSKLPFVCDATAGADGCYPWPYGRPIEEKKPEINWSEWEGKMIKVSRPSLVAVERKLIKYDPSKKNPFICEDIGSSEMYCSWATAELIKERKIEWAKVPEWTPVKCSSVSEEEAKNKGNRYFITKVGEKFWSTGEDRKAAFPHKYCVLAEPCKDEWLEDE